MFEIIHFQKRLIEAKFFARFNHLVDQVLERRQAAVVGCGDFLLQGFNQLYDQLLIALPDGDDDGRHDLGLQEDRELAFQVWQIVE